MRRFWTEATVEPSEKGFHILLDSKPMRLPGGPVLHVSQRPLADAIAREWQDAGGGPGREMSFDDVQLTRLAGTAQERIAPDPAPTVEALSRYAEADLLCYRADWPRALVERQAALWQPWLDWAARELRAELRVTSGVVHVSQPPEALAAMRRAVAAQSVATLAGLGIIVPALGSLVLGLAVAQGRLDAAEAHGLATLDELYQEGEWGEDRDAVIRRAQIGQEIATAARFMELLRA
jgi:chaperone required for assembly of F1-ATPase